jgi:hypothetical protein
MHRSFSNAPAFNRYLDTSGLKGAPLTDDEHQLLVTSVSENRAAMIDTLLQSHGYEFYFNPQLVIDSASRIAEHILALEWQLIEAAAPSFILSDSPMPTHDLGHSFRVGLTDRFALQTAHPATPVREDTVVVARLGSGSEIAAVNADVRARATSLICGPKDILLGL